ncbi:MAG: porin [Phycisphaerales bacterium]|nr:porin [Phycisphaerales bacterium]
MTKIALMLLAGATVSTAALADTTSMTRDEVRGMVSEMLSDAETRSSLLQGGGMVGYDKGFMVGSADGNWKLKFNGLIQFRYMMNFRDSSDIAVGDDDLTNGFQLRKARVVLSGNAVNPNLTYVIAFETGTGQQGPGTFIDTDHTTDSDGDGNDLNDSDQLIPGSGGGWIANDVMFAYNLGDGWSIRGGQYKVGFLREELLSEANTIGVERGVMNNFFNQGRSQGVGFKFENNDWRFSVDMSDGLNTANTDFNNAAESEFALTARGGWKWAGSWDQLMDYTSKPGDANAGSVGGALTWQTATQPAGPTDASSMWGATVDAQWEGNGFGLFGAFVYTAVENGTGASDINHMGGTFQANYRWNETSEVFAKWDGIFLDNDDAGVSTALDEDCHFLTFGYNHYFAGNNAKLTIDCIYSFNENANLVTATTTNGGQPGVTASGLSTNNGLLGSSDGGEFAIRGQFQLAF